jgi:14-3-3 protein epsilon
MDRTTAARDFRGAVLPFEVKSDDNLRGDSRLKHFSSMLLSKNSEQLSKSARSFQTLSGRTTLLMTLDRDLTFFMARVADQAERWSDVISSLKLIISFDPSLNTDERNLLSVAYKAIAGSRRSALRTVNTLLEDPTIRAFPDRVTHIRQFKTKLVDELDSYCTELIDLTDSKLLPAATSPATKVFFEKLKADYYRYSVEFKGDADRRGGSDRARASYDSAWAIATSQLGKADPAFLGLALNYSVFLYEIIGKKQEAIELADRVLAEAVGALDDAEDSEAILVLQLLKDNVALWKRET